MPGPHHKTVTVAHSRHGLPSGSPVSEISSSLLFYDHGRAYDNADRFHLIIEGYEDDTPTGRQAITIRDQDELKAVINKLSEWVED